MNGLRIRSSEHITFASLLVVGLVVRLMGIVSRPIWYDEAIIILFAQKGFSAMLAGTLIQDASGVAANVHPLAYHTILWGWMKIFGESIVSVRMLSIIFGLGAIVLAYLLVRNIFANERLAFVSALGVALAPFIVHYSQEIRMYALLALALIGATCFFWHGLHSSQLRWWIGFAFCAALAQYTQNLAVFYLVPLALTSVFLRRRDKVIKTFIAGIVAILLYLPWLIHIPAQLAKIQTGYWVERPTFSTIFTTLLAFVTNLPVFEGWLPLALIITLLVTVLAVYQTWLAFRKKLSTAHRGLWLAYLAFMPPTLAFLVSQWQPIYIERAFIASGIMFWLWLAWALTATDMPRLLRTLSLLLLSAGIIFGLATHLTYDGFPYGPYQAIDASLESRILPGDVIVHSNKLTLLPAVYFDQALEQRFVADPPGSGTDTFAPATQNVLNLNESVSLEDATAGAERVWFVIFQKSIDEATGQGLDTHPHIIWLDEHFRFKQMEVWGPVVLYLYTH